MTVMNINRNRMAVLLGSFIVASLACSSPVDVSDVNPNFQESDLIGVIPDATVVSSIAGIETDTTFAITLPATTGRVNKLSPAWVEQQRWNTTPFDGSRAHRDYFLTNPNDLSTPMGALCWAHYETESALFRHLIRNTIDNDLILPYVETLGLTDRQIGNGAEATEFLRELLGNQDSNDIIISEDILTVSAEELSRLKDDWRNMIEPLDEIGGNGTEWMEMFREVTRPEVEVATRAGEGLYAPVRVYADALFAAVDEYLDGTRTDFSDKDGLSYKLPNWRRFVEVAKYSPDCQRAWLGFE